MGIGDSSTIFTSRSRQYRLGENESMMVHYITLAEVRTKKMRKNGQTIERLLHGKRWTAEEFMALLPGGFGGGGIIALAQRVKDEMDAGWHPLE
jgi:hypothetical protein